MLNARRVLLVLCLGLSGLGCGAVEPVPRPLLKAQLHATLTGHTEVVWRVAFSPDGRWLASGSREKGAFGTLWKEIAGERLSGGKGRTVHLWRVSDGSLQQVLAEHSGDVHSVAFSHDGGWLAGSGYDKTVKLWRLEAAPPRAP